MEKLYTALVLSLIITAYALDGRVEERARQYKGYDELLSNVSVVSYGNATYYWVEYEKNLMYSGALVVDGNYSAVSDVNVIRSFVVADLMRKNYPKNTASQWQQFSGYFSSMASAFSQGKTERLANDSKEIADMLSKSSYLLNRSIDSFAPADAEEYMNTESRIVEKMDAAYQNTLNYSEKDSAYLKEYRESLLNIRRILSENHEGLVKSGDYLAGNIRMRVVSDKNRTAMEALLIAMTILLILFILFMKFRRSRSSRQPQHPQASSGESLLGRP